MYAPHSNLEDAMFIILQVALSLCSYRHISCCYLSQRDFNGGILSALQTRCEDVIRDDWRSIFPWIPDLGYVLSAHEPHNPQQYFQQRYTLLCEASCKHCALR